MSTRFLGIFPEANGGNLARGVALQQRTKFVVYARAVVWFTKAGACVVNKV